MADSVTEQRIADRTRIAEAQMQQEGPFKRAWSKAGLGVANMIDRWNGSPQEDARTVFEGGFTSGAMRGGLMGLAAGITVAALFGLGWLPVLAITAISAVTLGAVNAQQAVDNDAPRNPPLLSDRIARETGAVPKAFPITKTPEQTLKAAGMDPALPDRVEALLHDPATQDSFAARETARRTTAQNTALSH